MANYKNVLKLFIINIRNQIISKVQKGKKNNKGK